MAAADMVTLELTLEQIEQECAQAEQCFNARTDRA